MDYYSVLGIEKTDDAKVIKSAYRKIAKENHPDLFPNDAEKLETFKKANEAYEILSDPEKKKNYDQFGDPNGGNNFGAGFNPFEGFNFNPFEGFMDDIFRGRNRSKGNTDIHANISLTPKDFLLGGKKSISINRIKFCDTCLGVGGEGAQICSQCQGKGAQVRVVQNGPFIQQTVEECHNCQGSGKTVTKKCDDCLGKKTKSISEIVDIDVPENCPLNATLQIGNKGNQEKKEFPCGHLFLSLHLDINKIKNADQRGDITIEHIVKVQDWISGAVTDINRFDVDHVSYNLQDLKDSTAQIVFKGKGLKDSNNIKQGDFIIHFKIVK